MRKDHFLIGLGIRVLMLFFFIHLNETNHYNDASLIIYKGFLHILKGENPYSYIYELPWGTGTFTQPLNYGPIVFILFLPAMFIPIWYEDLWIGMAIMINLYCFGIAELISNIGSNPHTNSNPPPNIDEKSEEFKKPNETSKIERKILYYGGILFWMIPVGTTVISVFIYAPIFISLLAFIFRRNAFLTGFFIMVGGLSYQLVLLFVPIYFVYYLKQDWKLCIKFVAGCLPAFLILLFFVFWQYPAGTIESLFLYTSTMPYVKCDNCGNNLDNFSFFSIPQLLFQWSNGSIQAGNYFRMGVVIILGVYCLWVLFNKRIISSRELPIQILKYQIIAVILFTISNNYGQIHYLLFTIVPLILYFQFKRNNLSVAEFEEYFEPNFKIRRIFRHDRQKQAQIFIFGTVSASLLLFIFLFGLYLVVPDYFVEFKITGYKHHYWVKWLTFSIGIAVSLLGILFFLKQKNRVLVNKD